MERRIDKLETIWRRRGIAPGRKGMPGLSPLLARLSMEEKHELDTILAALEAGQRRGLSGTSALSAQQERRLYDLLERVEETRERRA